MKTHWLAVTALALMAARVQAAPAITGDYVESRSANIYVGACHHEGELLTTGRNAVLAWNITAGEVAGVSLAGVRALAVVAADKNLEFADARRKSVLYIDAAATPAQRDALAELLRQRADRALGEVVAVKTVAISFDATGGLYRIGAPGVAAMKIKKQTEMLCCKQPYELWDKPFVTLKGARAGYCMGVEYKDSTLLSTWSATDQNNAYFGTFSL